MPHIETGFIETKYDTLNASVDTIKISIKGKELMVHILKMVLMQ